MGKGQAANAIENVLTATLIPYVRNARTHSDSQVAQIAGSIQEFGFNNPVLIDAENVIIAGHGRVMAATLLKLERVPCIRLAHLSDAQKRAYVLADNRIALNSGWDTEMLANELSDNKNLLSFNLTVGPKDYSQKILDIEYSPVDKAIQKVRDIATRNRVRNMATLAGAVMSRRQNLLSHVPGALPTLPPEINQLLFEATVDYISPNDAQTLYNTVLPFTPLPGNQ